MAFHVCFFFCGIETSRTYVITHLLSQIFLFVGFERRCYGMMMVRKGRIFFVLSGCCLYFCFPVKNRMELCSGTQNCSGEPDSK